ncbi:MAG: ergothioneine biosynthesis protein EgtC [Gammaproteobacteria bacterium]|nr:ergothioneine biosynthesis protein EgtC [Gammaproteobacteria bacterium]
MCRLATYLGPEISLEKLLLHPAHSLMRQSWGPQEMREGKLNADGYGFGWFDQNGVPAAYANPMPIWTDPNLPALARTLSTDMWLANVRSATLSSDVSHANTQPFNDDQYIFLHNGYIKDFALNLRHWVRCRLAPEIDCHIRGTTDSEHLFALFRQIMKENAAYSISDGIRQMLTEIENQLGDKKALLNIVIADKQSITAVRHALNGECPTLYYTSTDQDYPGASLIASEKLTPSSGWQAVSDHSVVVMRSGNPVELTSL